MYHLHVQHAEQVHVFEFHFLNTPVLEQPVKKKQKTTGLVAMPSSQVTWSWSLLEKVLGHLVFV